MLRPAARGVTGAHVSIASWKLILCVGTGLRNPDSPFKPVSISEGTSRSPWSREPGSHAVRPGAGNQAAVAAWHCVGIARGCSVMQGAAHLRLFPGPVVRAGKRMGLASDLSQGQREGVGFPP